MKHCAINKRAKAMISKVFISLISANHGTQLSILPASDLRNLWWASRGG
jgi:hypothetical protein